MAALMAEKSVFFKLMASLDTVADKTVFGVITSKAFLMGFKVFLTALIDFFDGLV